MTAYLLTDESCPACQGLQPGINFYCPACAGTGRRLVTLAAALAGARTDPAYYAAYDRRGLSRIEDPLAWQAEVDASGLSPNTRGAARFWRTVGEALGVPPIARDGCPECSELVIDLPGYPGVGVRLYTEEQGEEAPRVRYEFVRLEETP